MPNHKLSAAARRVVISFRLRGETIRELDRQVARKHAVDKRSNRSTIVEGYIMERANTVVRGAQIGARTSPHAGSEGES